MSVTSYNKTVKVGDSDNLNVALVDGNGTPIAITGSKIFFSVKIHRDRPDSKALILKRNTAAGGSDEEIDITSGAGGTFIVYIDPADTYGSTGINGFYDIQVEFASGEVRTVLEGDFVAEIDVTRGTDPDEEESV